MNKYKVHLNEGDEKAKKLYHLCFNDDSISIERVLKPKIIIAYSDMEMVMFGADGENSMIINENNGHKLRFGIVENRQAIMSSFIGKNVRVAVV